MAEETNKPEENKADESSALTKLDKNLDVADSVLGKIGNIVKKRWKTLILLLVGYLCYWFFGLVNEEIKNGAEPSQTEQMDNGTYVDDSAAYYAGDTLSE